MIVYSNTYNQTLIYSNTYNQTLISTYVLRLNWNAAAAPEGIANYRLYCNGVIISNTSNLEYVMDEVEYCTDYIFYVVALTNTGRISKKSNILLINICDIVIGENGLSYNLNFDI